MSLNRFISPCQRLRNHQERGGRKILRARGSRCLWKNSICCIWQSCYTHIWTHRGYNCMHVTCTRSTEPQFKNGLAGGGGGAHKVPALAQKPLLTDGCWGRQSQSSSGMWYASRSRYSHSVYMQVALSGFHGLTKQRVGWRKGSTDTSSCRSYTGLGFQFLAHTQYFTTNYNSGSKGSDILFWPLWVSGTYVVHIYTNRQNPHTHTFQKSKFQKLHVSFLLHQ